MLHVIVMLIWHNFWRLEILEEQLETQRFKEGIRFFIYAPPLKGVRASKRTPPKRPFPNAPPFKHSVYYYWWAFLRRSDAYKKCCEKGGKGKLSKIYDDFGDVFQECENELDTFWNWWTSKHPVSGERRGQTLFAEPPARQIGEADNKINPSADTLIIEVPLELRTAYLINQFRKLLSDYDKRAKTAQAKSRAMYPVAIKPVLSSLHNALAVYDAVRANKSATKKKKLWQLFDELSKKLDNFYVDETYTIKFDEDDDDLVIDLPKWEREAKEDESDDVFLRQARDVVRRRKANAMKRQERIAKQYIQGVENGKFPYKTYR